MESCFRKRLIVLNEYSYKRINKVIRPLNRAIRLLLEGNRHVCEILGRDLVDEIGKRTSFGIVDPTIDPLACDVIHNRGGTRTAVLLAALRFSRDSAVEFFGFGHHFVHRFEGGVGTASADGIHNIWNGC